ncbi:MAG TPA: hypothetical protein VL485_11095 [Ktedonobacteraceae bacterium]|nr:hypothetical protein [Ktedonobacteraceae bacterium]
MYNLKYCYQESDWALFISAVVIGTHLLNAVNMLAAGTNRQGMAALKAERRVRETFQGDKRNLSIPYLLV